MCHVPSTLQELQIASGYRKRIPSRKLSKTAKGDSRLLAPQLTRELCIGAKANNIPFHKSSLIAHLKMTAVH